MECWASILTLTFGTSRTAELSTSRAGRALPPRIFLCVEWTPGIMMADKGVRSLESFQGLRRESSAQNSGAVPHPLRHRPLSLLLY
jgi:hypothetical protein